MLREQTILTAEQAKEWGLIQDIRTDFMEPGAVLLSVNAPQPEEKPKESISPLVVSTPGSATTKQ